MNKRRKTRLKNLLQEQRMFSARVLAAGLFMAAGFGILVGRLWYLQSFSYQKYATASLENRVNLQVIPPTRGLIFDRNGTALASNQPTYGLYLIPERVPDLEKTLSDLQQIIELSEEQLEQFRSLVKSHKPFERVPLRSRLDEEETAHFAVRNHAFPGVLLQAALNRHYPHGLLTAHAVGYVGSVTREDLGRLDADRYRGTYHTGKQGVERTYEHLLHGYPGHQQVEVDAHGRVIRVLSKTPPVAGQNLHLSLDLRLQKLASEALADQNGAVVAMDPGNGELLAFVSRPSFDPNLFVHGISSRAYRALLHSEDRPLFNRALKGQYPPGSTIKPFLGLAGLQEGEITEATRFYCPGHFQLPQRERRYRCWKRTGHGSQNLHQAIAESCDVYFYQLATRLGIDRMTRVLEQFGFGRGSGIDLPGESPGLLPSREWKKQTRGEPWYEGETVITGIGQGFLLTTPLQLAFATSILSQRGGLPHPHLVTSTTPLWQGPAARQPISAREPHWRTIIRGMEAVFNDPRGTAHQVGRNPVWPMAGKSGTSQVFGLSQDDEETGEVAEKLQDHALFIAFAPVEAPKISVAVIVENGGSGSRAAAPIARALIDHHLRNLRADRPET